MKAHRTIRIIGTFYRNFFLLNFLTTLTCAALFREYGWSIFSQLVMVKFIVQGLTILLISEYKSKEFYYYHNMGLSKKILWISTLGFDLLILILLMTVYYMI